MGMFDDLAGKAMGMLGGVGQSGMLSQVSQLFAGGDSGGIDGLLETLKSKGLGDVVSSWVGKGENLPVSADQLKDALGGDLLEKLAAKTGSTSDDIASKMSEYLPGIVDKLTPDGEMPEGGLMARGQDLIKGFFS